jgi:hypothetical protein
MAHPGMTMIMLSGTPTRKDGKITRDPLAKHLGHAAGLVGVRHVDGGFPDRDLPSRRIQSSTPNPFIDTPVAASCHSPSHTFVMVSPARTRSCLRRR